MSVLKLSARFDPYSVYLRLYATEDEACEEAVALHLVLDDLVVRVCLPRTDHHAAGQSHAPGQAWVNHRFMAR